MAKKTPRISFLITLLSLACLSACGASKSTVSEQVLEDVSTEAVAKMILGAVNSSGSISPDSTASCKVSTGSSASQGYSCLSRCELTSYQIQCATSEKKKYTCGRDEFEWNEGTFAGTSNFTDITWKDDIKPVGSQTSQFSLQGHFEHPLVSGRLDCNLSANLIFSADRDLPAITLDCAKFRCSLGGSPLDCASLQSFLVVNLCY